MQGKVDLAARETWFYEAGGGSAYWFGAHGSTGSSLDDGSTYSFTVPVRLRSES